MDKALLALLISICVSMLGLGVVSPILALYAVDLGATGMDLAMIFSGFALARLLISPVAGRASDLKGRKKTLLLGLATYAAASLAYPLAWSPTSIMAVRFLHGIGSGTVLPTASAYVADLAPRGREGRYMGSLNVALFLGMGLGPLMGGLVADLQGIRTSFLLMTLFVLVGLVLTVRYVPEVKAKSRVASTSLDVARKIVADRPLRGVLVYRFVQGLGRANIMSFLSLLAVQTLDLSIFEAGIILSVGQVTNAVIQGPLGVLADRFGKAELIAVGSGVAVAGFALIPSASGFYDCLLYRLLISFGSALALPATRAIMAIESRSIGAGSTMGAYEMVTDAGRIIGPMVSGFLMETAGIGYVFYGSAVATAVGISLLYLHVFNSIHSALNRRSNRRKTERNAMSGFLDLR